MKPHCCFFSMNHTVNSTCLAHHNNHFSPVLVVFHFDMGDKAMILTAPSLKVVVCLLWRVTSKSPVALGSLRTVSEKRWYTCLVTSLWHMSILSTENKASIGIPLSWKKTAHINANKIKNGKMYCLKDFDDTYISFSGITLGFFKMLAWTIFLLQFLNKMFKTWQVIRDYF